MKILFVAVFDDAGVSSNTSQARGLKELGHEVVCYNYRIRASRIGVENRNIELIDFAQHQNFDLAIFAKANTVHPGIFNIFKENGCKVCYWFPDPLITYNKPEFLQMTANANFFCADKQNVIDLGSSLNKNSHKVPDGYDSLIEIPRKLKKDIDVSFIGSLHSDRKEKIDRINHPVQVFSSAFGEMHSEIVTRSKICLNFCTTEGASDRTYKTLAAEGFYLTDDWQGRKDMFEDKHDLVLYDSIDDLNLKIDYYLKNDDQRQKIAKNGSNTVEAYSRKAWAIRIIDIANGLS